MKNLIFLFFLLPQWLCAQNFSLSDSSVQVGDRVTLSGVQFEKGKTILKRTSYPSLDSLVTFMLKQKGVILEVGSHTDYSHYEYSSCLTCRRADSIVGYLVNRGVSRVRLKPKGYAGSQVITIDPSGSELNIRTEFTVLSTDFKDYLVNAWVQVKLTVNDTQTNMGACKMFLHESGKYGTFCPETMETSLLGKWYIEGKKLYTDLQAYDILEKTATKIKIGKIQGGYSIVLTYEWR